jgi:PAS domain S-box-containing protein
VHDCGAVGVAFSWASIARRAFAVVLLLLGTVSNHSRAEERPRHVLMLHAYESTFPYTAALAEAARKRLLESQQAIDISADFLDLARFPDAAHEQRAARFLAEKYAGKQPDVVMTFGSAALPFMTKHGASIAPQVPVIAAGISPANFSQTNPPPGITGVINRFDLGKTLGLAEQLQPGVRRVVVIAGAGETDRRWQGVARSLLDDHRPRLDVTYLFELPHREFLARVSQLPADTIVLLLTVFMDGEGKSFIPRDVAREIGAASSAPVYAPYDTYMGGGIVGGYVDTLPGVGAAAADIALQILDGRDPKTLPPQVNAALTYRVDARALARFGLSERNLPPGTEVLFGEPTLWKQYRGLVVATSLILFFQTAGVAALLFQMRRRRRAERSLKESEERMTFAAASSNVGLWHFDRASNELWATDHCREMFGIAPDARITRDTFLDRIHPEDRQIALESIKTAGSGESAVTEFRVPQPDGQARWFRARARAHPDDQGRATGLSGIFVDISDFRNAEMQAELQRRELAHLMRVSVVGELSGAIAHELNQPLSAMLSNAQAVQRMLKMASPSLAEIKDTMNDIVIDNNRAGEVIRRLRGLLKKGESKTEPIDFNELASSTLRLLHSELIARGIKTRLDLSAGLPTVLGDPIQVQQVLINLIMNAMDAMASTAPQRRLLRLTTRLTADNQVECAVTDRGRGIAPDALGRMFEPFYTTKDHGLGLGLSICKSIARSHGGDLTIVNGDGGGARAVLVVPAALQVMAAAE